MREPVRDNGKRRNNNNINTDEEACPDGCASSDFKATTSQTVKWSNGEIPPFMISFRKKLGYFIFFPLF